jgi:uncharacterized protein YkwD
MLRSLAVSFVVLAIIGRPCAAETAAPAVEIHDSSGNENGSPSPNPHSGAPAAGPSSALSSVPGEDSAAESELLELANKSRELAGVPPLRMDESLRLAARAHAARMVESEQLEHRLPGEASLFERVALVSSLVMDRVGENIAYAESSPRINDNLMHSPRHRDNLLNREFNVAGMAALWNKGRLYVVQDFAHEVPSYSAQQSAGLISRAIGEVRQQAGLPELVQRNPAKLDDAVCSLAQDNPPNPRRLAPYENRKIVTYTQSRPEVLPAAAVNMIRDPSLRQFAVGACYARNAAHPAGAYWVAILLY